MKAPVRMLLFLAGAAVVAAEFFSGVAGLHPVGEAAGLRAEVYGNLVNRVSVERRHITDAVSAVNFDIRGFDTLGEEFILFACVMAVLLLLRRQPDERDGPPIDRAPNRLVSPASDAVRVLTVALAGPIVVFGIYIVVHGQVSPGGGFQGGVILASAPLLIYLATGYRTLLKIAPRSAVELFESVGAGAYIVVGLAGLFLATAFLHNFLPMGEPGDVFSGGTVAVIDLAVGLEVACGFILLLFAFLEEMLVRRDPE